MACLRSGPRRAFRCIRAFTLVELLVVIGIIALLISVLLPVLGKAKESARQTQCLSNIRQLAFATISFANEHRGFMPGRAGGTVLGYIGSDKLQPGGTAQDAESSSDWIAWHRVKDPITGLVTATSAGSAGDQNITHSALARYMGAKVARHSTPDEANAANPTLESVFRCPSDNLEARGALNPANGLGQNAYRYSYSINDLFAMPVQAVSPPITGGGTYAVGARYGGSTFTGKLSSIRAAGEKILFVCEDEQTIDDGVFKPTPGNWDNAKVNAIAGRHRVKRASATSTVQPGQRNVDTFGNVGFCDGHAEYMSRKDALRAKYSGRPDPDPPGF